VGRRAPEPRDIKPTMPADMDTAAQVVWKRVLREFGAANVITAADTDALRCYCEAVSRYTDAARMLAQSSPLVRGARGGELVRNPLHQIVRDNADLVRVYARELGLTPSARTGLGSRADEADSALDAFAARRAAH